MSQFKYCYVRELSKNPSLKGRIIIKFTLAGDGQVSTADIYSSTMNSRAVETGLISRFLRLQFPIPTDENIVIVSYPILFSS